MCVNLKPSNGFVVGFSWSKKETAVWCCVIQTKVCAVAPLTNEVYVEGKIHWSGWQALALTTRNEHDWRRIADSSSPPPLRLRGTGIKLQLRQGRGIEPLHVSMPHEFIMKIYHEVRWNRMKHFIFPIGKQKGISNTVTILAQGTHCRPFSEAFLKSYCGFCTTGNRCANYFWMPHWFCFFYNCCKYLCGLRVIFAHRWKSLLPPFLFSQEGSLKVPKGERSCDRMGRSRNMGGGIVCFAKSRYQSLSHGKCPMTKNWKSLFMISQIVNATVRLLLPTFDQESIVSLARKSRLDPLSGRRRQMPGNRAKLYREVASRLLRSARFEPVVAFFGHLWNCFFEHSFKKAWFQSNEQNGKHVASVDGERGMKGPHSCHHRNSVSGILFGENCWVNASTQTLGLDATAPHCSLSLWAAQIRNRSQICLQFFP